VTATSRTTFQDGPAGDGLVVAHRRPAQATLPQRELEEVARAKQAVRERVWARLERERAARFPGATGWIPNFAGASAAADRLASLPAWRAARVVKSNPDAPQLPVGHEPWPTASSCTWPSPA
jgi:hypothetical protein